jgi:hypothetical protein
VIKPEPGLARQRSEASRLLASVNETESPNTCIAVPPFPHSFWRLSSPLRRRAAAPQKRHPTRIIAPRASLSARAPGSAVIPLLPIPSRSLTQACLPRPRHPLPFDHRQSEAQAQARLQRSWNSLRGDHCAVKRRDYAQLPGMGSERTVKKRRTTKTAGSCEPAAS